MGIRLALSGGGFRATLFHLGVVRYLRETARLKDIEAMSSVSGGSILAAHLALNWDKYNGDHHGFQETTTELVEFTQRNVRGRLLRWWLFLWALALVLWLAPVSLIPYFSGSSKIVATLGSIAWFISGLGVIARYRYLWSLIRALEQGYNSRLYHEWKHDSGRFRLRTATLSQLKKTLHILTTDLTTGELCSFDERGFHVYTAAGLDYKVKNFDQPQLPIGRAVAASSAFPVLFSPVRLSDDDFGAPTLNHPQMLADGGIFENFGVEGFAAVYSGQAWPHDSTLLLSDGQAVFNSEDLRKFGLLDSRADRTIDVLMHRVSLWQLNQQAIQRSGGGMPTTQPAPTKAAQIGTVPNSTAQPVAAANPATNPIATANLVASISAAERFKHASLARNVQGSWALTPGLQNRIARIRTDLDAFSDVEIHLLVYQGFCAARAAFEPQTQDGTLGEQKLPPAGAYTEGWNPTAPFPLAKRVRDQLDDNKLDKVFGIRSRLGAGFRELIAPLNWATLLVISLGFVTFFPVLNFLTNWWSNRPIEIQSWDVAYYLGMKAAH